MPEIKKRIATTIKALYSPRPGVEFVAVPSYFVEEAIKQMSPLYVTVKTPEFREFKLEYIELLKEEDTRSKDMEDKNSPGEMYHMKNYKLNRCVEKTDITPAIDVEIESKSDKIYSLKLHETTFAGQVQIMRVPNGWIYTHLIGNRDQATCSTFVPFNKEFKRQDNGDF